MLRGSIDLSAFVLWRSPGQSFTDRRDRDGQEPLKEAEGTSCA